MGTRPRLPIFAVLAAAMLGGLAPAGAAPRSTGGGTVDTMTCAAAQRQVAATGRYEKRTPYGVLPIIPAYRLQNGYANCPIGSDPTFFTERTLDQSSCILGFSCERRNNR